MSAETILDLCNVSKDFSIAGTRPFDRAQKIHAVSDVTLQISKGETFGLVGESGSGKTTLGRLILGMDTPSAGQISFDSSLVSDLGGKYPREFRKRMQLIFQDPFSSLNPSQSVGDMLGEIIRFHRLARGRDTVDQRVRELMQLVGLDPAYAGRFPHQFSGGQRQRVVIARALATEPDLVVADEPVSALDVSIQAQILQLLKKTKEERDFALLLIAHDLAIIQYMCDRVGVLYLGRLVEIGPVEEVFQNPRHPYTQMLLSVVPSFSRKPVFMRQSVKGEIPSPISLPSGCAFRTRCRLARAECSTFIPALETVGAQHFCACPFNEELARC